MKIFSLKCLALAGMASLCQVALAADAVPISPSAQSESAPADLQAQLDALKAQASGAVTWALNVDLREDYAPYKLTSSEQKGTASHPLVHYGVTYTAGAGALADAPANGYAGGYIRRVELGATGKLAPWVSWSAQIDLAALKLEDVGLDAKTLPLLPGLSVPGYEWELKLGQYRQPFGIENQTGSLNLPFPERAIMDGGYCPAAFSSATPVKLVYERIFGAQLITGHNYGAFGYKLQAALGDDQKDQDPGSSATLGAFGGAISNTYTAATQSLGLTTDQDPSEFARVGLDLNALPTVATLSVGASAIHNPTNSKLLAVTGTAESWQDTYGFDALLGIPAAKTQVQGEWVCQNSFANDASSYAAKGVHGQLIGRAEGWYIESSTKPLAFFNKDWTQMDLNLRLEDVVPDVNAAGRLAPFVATSVQANTVGLKWSYKGRNYTSLNYTNYALNGDYKAIAGSSLFSVQQQINY
jgi:hypothetical protein